VLQQVSLWDWFLALGFGWVKRSFLLAMQRGWWEWIPPGVKRPSGWFAQANWGCLALEMWV
jgi:hypothetical protein